MKQKILLALVVCDADIMLGGIQINNLLFLGASISQ